MNLTDLFGRVVRKCIFPEGFAKKTQNGLPCRKISVRLPRVFGTILDPPTAHIRQKLKKNRISVKKLIFHHIMGVGEREQTRNPIYIYIYIRVL